eukprot:CAMPEP_0174846138 /NCGR_PEP_ID=MMETSP1114-20130205/12148_1 /TAXON_ID=312471 /ORGANISM="Neobodo designis, Strain CCAP 1951/1" /LENGTH=935 /DNA_ID=CAMNT_0016080401 /DNA_START=333 /DNA_END=3140 /DNA_ORIENTATION=+
MGCASSADAAGARPSSAQARGDPTPTAAPNELQRPPTLSLSAGASPDPSGGAPPPHRALYGTLRESSDVTLLPQPDSGGVLPGAVDANGSARNDRASPSAARELLGYSGKQTKSAPSVGGGALPPRPVGSHSSTGGLGREVEGGSSNSRRGSSRSRPRHNARHVVVSANPLQGKATAPDDADSSAAVAAGDVAMLPLPTSASQSLRHPNANSSTSPASPVAAGAAGMSSSARRGSSVTGSGASTGRRPPRGASSSTRNRSTRSRHGGIFDNAAGLQSRWKEQFSNQAGRTPPGSAAEASPSASSTTRGNNGSRMLNLNSTSSQQQQDGGDDSNPFRLVPSGSASQIAADMRLPTAVAMEGVTVQEYCALEHVFQPPPPESVMAKAQIHLTRDARTRTAIYTQLRLAQEATRVAQWIDDYLPSSAMGVVASIGLVSHGVGTGVVDAEEKARLHDDLPPLVARLPPNVPALDDTGEVSGFLLSLPGPVRPSSSPANEHGACESFPTVSSPGDAVAGRRGPPPVSTSVLEVADAATPNPAPATAAGAGSHCPSPAAGRGGVQAWHGVSSPVQPGLHDLHQLPPGASRFIVGPFALPPLRFVSVIVDSTRIITLRNGRSSYAAVEDSRAAALRTRYFSSPTTVHSATPPALRSPVNNNKRHAPGPEGSAAGSAASPPIALLPPANTGVALAQRSPPLGVVRPQAPGQRSHAIAPTGLYRDAAFPPLDPEFVVFAATPPGTSPAMRSTPSMHASRSHSVVGDAATSAARGGGSGIFRGSGGCSGGIGGVPSLSSVQCGDAPLADSAFISTANAAPTTSNPNSCEAGELARISVSGRGEPPAEACGSPSSTLGFQRTHTAPFESHRSGSDAPSMHRESTGPVNSSSPDVVTSPPRADGNRSLTTAPPSPAIGTMPPAACRPPSPSETDLDTILNPERQDAR